MRRDALLGRRRAAADARRRTAQCCILDLDTGLPVQVRDAALGVESNPIPQSDVGKEYAVAQIAQQARAAVTHACAALRSTSRDGILTLVLRSRTFTACR